MINEIDNKLTRQDLSILNKMARKSKYTSWRNMKKLLWNSTRISGCLLDGIEKTVILSREKEAKNDWKGFRI